jgi:hypothetical protein
MMKPPSWRMGHNHGPAKRTTLARAYSPDGEGPDPGLLFHLGPG